ncbi:uncharacterized protein MELLADRAFT_73430 [Melampsora larici-populina 98AG31]|uniref:TMEM205-like domain-containing protein n=1 Tax=Melampsora larici-populina (strain 98AG31 / pathotype 3-4-7) TaxID=747676 RepID=F4S826_MELLP|nr:uncharacterized protein MELLADRAFT_73430 [Melampsora larici-populina 98AG31]EGF99210.1 hypothetical protein MELLADRAFT_73430 [Melampsora larici-populina 98AG31]
MPQVNIHSLAQATFSPRSAFHLALATNIGAGIWVSFIGGVIMYKNLPRPVFGNIQRKLFPAYFTLGSALSAVLFSLQLKLSPTSQSQLFRPSLSSAFLIPLLLSSMTISSLTNLLYIGPKTTKIMLNRHALEEEEKKQYNDSNVGDEMKALNKQFGIAHGISSSLNVFGYLVPSVFVCLWVGEHGFS